MAQIYKRIKNQIALSLICVESDFWV